MESKIVIIGAGPTGLGAGYRLKEVGYKNFQLYDKLDHVGGLASSYTDSAGFTWDVGGHVMFSHYKYYDQCFDDLMGNEALVIILIVAEHHVPAHIPRKPGRIGIAGRQASNMIELVVELEVLIAHF